MGPTLITIGIFFLSLKLTIYPLVGNHKKINLMLKKNPYLSHNVLHLFTEVFRGSPLMVTQDGHSSVSSVVGQHFSSNWILSYQRENRNVHHKSQKENSTEKYIIGNFNKIFSLSLQLEIRFFFTNGYLIFNCSNKGDNTNYIITHKSTGVTYSTKLQIFLLILCTANAHRSNIQMIMLLF